jgi:hypothetical protein
VLVEVGRISDSLAEYLTAFSVLRLVGRPRPVRPGGVVNELLRKLCGSIPVRDDRLWIERLVSKRRKDISEELVNFNRCLDALGQANTQFMLEVRADRKERTNSRQIWRKEPGQILSSEELLSRITRDTQD